MKKRLFSLVLCLVMVFSLLPAFSLNASAAEPDDGITNPGPAHDESGALNLTKKLTSGANGTYDITMESWATGEVKAVEEKIPTDFVVVVDQSGSMADSDMPTGDPTVQNNKYLEDVAAGAYYVKDGDHYYRVYGVQDYLFRYYPANYWWTGSVIEHLGTSLSWFMGESDATTNFNNAFYFREVVNGVTYYEPIRTTVAGKIGAYVMYYSYPSKATNGTFKFNRDDTTYSTNGNSPWFHKAMGGGTEKEGALWNTLKSGFNTFYKPRNQYVYGEVAFVRWGMYINYPMYDRHVGYTKLCYRDVNGVEHEVPSNGGQTTWEFCNANEQAITSQEGSRPTYSGLYTFPNTGRRIDALQTALNEFAEKIANETDSFGAVDNRVSIIGFSSNENTYKNTELLTGTTFEIQRGGVIDSRYGYSADGYNHNGKMKSEATAADYAGALVSATGGSAGTVNNEIKEAIGAVTAYGGTQPEDGLDMAYNVLTNRGEGEGKTTYTIRSGANKGQSVDRNTVVIFFTDGRPGDHHYSNQYAEANEVVGSAARIKALDVEPTIFSIGVFGESDGNPLTYDGKNDMVEDPSHQGQMIQVKNLADRKLWEYLGGWVETYQNGGTYYCLRRQWRPNNAEGYTAEPNDTIYDYMSVVSSNYPDAEEFITAAWLAGNHEDNYEHATDGVRSKSTAETTNKYYRMASNQQTLIEAFLQAATMNNEETNTGVVLDNTAILKDTVNLADFDASGATFTAYSVDANTDGTFGTEAKQTFNPQYDETTGEVTVTGFNYSEKYVSAGHQGEKLIVKITGLAPKKTEDTLYSNKGNAGVYGAGVDDPTVQIASPTLNLSTIAAKTYVIDFNAKMKVAVGAYQLTAAETNNNGVFAKSKNEGPYDVTYQLDSGKQADKIATINSAYTDVDTALVYGKPYDLDAKKFAENAGWTKINTVPASSVYYDDDFTGEDAPTVSVGEGHGYNVEIDGKAVSEGAENVTGPFFFTFYGTGIDVYCTTHENGGYVSAAVFSGSGASACTATNRVGDAKTIRNYSDSSYYNTPSVSFTGLTAGTYTLKINAPTNAQFKLDGVRVYNPVKAEDAEHNQTDASKTLETTDEANANYLNLREFLLNAQGGFSVVNKIPQDGTIDPVAVSGVLFINDVDSVVTESHWYKDDPSDPEAVDEWHEDAAPIYQSQFDVYKANGPKNEIYLDGQQGITFQLSNKVPVGKKVWIGLSAPFDGNGSVSITGKDGSVSVNSVMDMYYDFTVPANRQITITNLADKGNGDIIAVTNLKITGIADLIPAVTQNNQEEVFHAARAVFAPVTMKTIRMAANNGVDPEEVVEEPENPNVPDTPDVPDNPDTPDTPDQPDDPKPVWNDGVNSVQTILKTLFQYLLNSLNSLFSGLGKW